MCELNAMVTNCDGSYEQISFGVRYNAHKWTFTTGLEGEHTVQLCEAMAVSAREACHLLRL